MEILNKDGLTHFTKGLLDKISRKLDTDKLPDKLPADGGNADTVNGKTVESNVPAQFTWGDLSGN